jgi:hypothetical protein
MSRHAGFPQARAFGQQRQTSCECGLRKTQGPPIATRAVVVSHGVVTFLYCNAGKAIPSIGTS